ncbi:hypothetical protein JCM10212_001231 [Sporobolomyces blumeae]
MSATESMTPDVHKENSLQRAYHYPVVKDTLSTAHGFVQANPYTSALYDRAFSLSAAIVARLEPLQKRLPLERVDGYANKGLDYVEKRFPQVKMETGEWVEKARESGDHAYETALSYRKGIEQRLGPVTDQFYATLAQSGDKLSSLQERLASMVAKLPHDQASIKKTLSDMSAELDSLVKSVPSLPQTAQAHAQPYIAGLSDAASYVSKELSRHDVPLSTRAQNVLKYSQDKLNPVLESVKGYVSRGKKEAVDKQQEVVDKVDDATTTSD